MWYCVGVVSVNKEGSMRKAMVLIAAMLLFFSPVYAHPPSDILIKFDPQTKILQAEIIHQVSNPASHFIAKVDVGLNNKEIISQVISRQDNNVSQTVSFLIPDASVGDILSVEGYCSLSGKLEKQIKVSGK